MHKLFIVLFILSIFYYSHIKESYTTPSTTTIDNPFSGGNYNISETTYNTVSTFINPNEDKNILTTRVTVDGVPILETGKSSL
jgi:hypothetical protein